MKMTGVRAAYLFKALRTAEVLTVVGCTAFFGALLLAVTWDAGVAVALPAAGLSTAIILRGAALGGVGRLRSPVVSTGGDSGEVASGRELESASEDSQQADSLLRRELARARRHQRPMAVVSVRLTESVEGKRRSMNSGSALTDAFGGMIRDIDYIRQQDGGRILLVLPETSGEAARMMVARLAANLDRGLTARLMVGIASFPEDEITWDALREHAIARETALLDSTRQPGSDPPDTPSSGNHASRQRLNRRPIGRVRRAVDVAAVVVAAPVVVPVLLLVAFMIKLDSTGAVLIRHRRLGHAGRPFQVLKFRTMVRNAEQLKEELAHLNTLPWPDFKIADDPRVTRVGRLLRKTSLDELPQLWNLFLGHVTLVGPRPCSVDVEKYELWQTERLEVIPGIFGRWQAEARASVSFDERCRMDIRQLRTRSIAQDLHMAAATVASVVAGRGAS